MGLTSAPGIYAHDKNTQKSKAYDPLPIFPGIFNTHTAVNKKFHARKRRIVSQAFSEAALQTSEPFILEKVRELCAALYAVPSKSERSLSGTWSEKKNLAHWSMLLPPV